jgi:hypothetical protein
MRRSPAVFRVRHEPLASERQRSNPSRFGSNFACTSHVARHPPPDWRARARIATAMVSPGFAAECDAPRRAGGVRIDIRLGSAACQVDRRH